MWNPSLVPIVPPSYYQKIDYVTSADPEHRSYDSLSWVVTLAIGVAFLRIIYCNSVLTRSIEPPTDCSFYSRRLARWKDSPGMLDIVLIFLFQSQMQSSGPEMFNVSRRAAVLWDIGGSWSYFMSIRFLSWIDLRKCFLVAMFMFSRKRWRFELWRRFF